MKEVRSPARRMLALLLTAAMFWSCVAAGGLAPPVMAAKETVGASEEGGAKVFDEAPEAFVPPMDEEDFPLSVLATVGASGDSDADDPYAYREIPRISTLGLSGSSGLNGNLVISGKVVFTQDIHTDTTNIPIRLMQRNPNNMTMQELAVYLAEPSGSYQFSGVSRGEYIVMVDKTDAYGEVRMIANMESANKNMNIALTENGVREFTLSGQVAGVENNANIPLQALDAVSGQLIEQTSTDGSGAFRFGALPHGDFDIRIDATDRYEAFTERIHVQYSHITDKILALTANHTLSGAVTGVDNVSGLTVDLYSANTKIKTTVTGADGHYQFTRLRDGVYTLKIAESPTYYAYSREVIIAGGNLAHEIWLQGFGFCQVRVVDSTGRAIPDAYIYAQQLDNSDYQSGYTNANGEWRFDWVAGKSYRVVASRSGNVSEKTVVNESEVVLKFPNLVTITGTVMDTSANPKAGYYVTVRRSDGTQWSVRTNSEGMYALDLADHSAISSYTLYTSNQVTYVSAERSENVTISSDELTTGKRVDLVVYPCEASGFVYGDTGQPLEGVRITQYGGYYYSTGKDGRFVITGILDSFNFYISYLDYPYYYESFNYILDKNAGKFVADKELNIYLQASDVNSTDYTVSLKSTALSAAEGDDVTFRPVITRNNTNTGKNVTLRMTLPDNVEMRAPGNLVNVGGNIYEYSFDVTKQETSLEPVTVRIKSVGSGVLNLVADLTHKDTSGYYTRKVRSDVLSIQVLYATISGPATHSTGQNIMIFGNASKDSEVRIKNKIGGDVYALVTSRNQFYSAYINLAPGADGKVKRYELIAEVRNSAVGGGLYYVSSEMTIDVGAGVVSVQDIVITDAHGRQHTSHPLYGIPVYTEYVYNDYNNGGFYGHSFQMRFSLKNSGGWTPTVTFCNNKVTARVSSTSGETTNYYVSIPYGWRTKGGTEDLRILLTKDGETIDYHAASVRMLIDPSGYVYDVDTNERIAGAKAILEKSTADGWVEWKDADGIQQNPQMSDEDGRYAWFTEEGKFRVRVSKSGYTNISGGAEAIANTAQGAYDDSIPDDSTLVVLPVQLDVNVPLKSTAKPFAEGGTIFNGPDVSRPNGGYSSSSGSTKSVSDSTKSPISTFESQIKAAKDASVIRISMAKQHSLSPRTLAVLKGRDVHLVLDFGWYQWTLYGKDIGELPPSLKNIDLTVRKESDAGRSGKVSNLDEMQLSMAHSGPLPMKMILSVKLPDAFPGAQAYLYSTRDDAILVDSGEVSQDKTASFVLDNAGLFAITARKLREADSIKYNPATGGSSAQIKINKKVAQQSIPIVADIRKTMEENAPSQGLDAKLPDGGKPVAAATQQSAPRRAGGAIWFALAVAAAAAGAIWYRKRQTGKR